MAISKPSRSITVTETARAWMVQLTLEEGSEYLFDVFFEDVLRAPDGAFIHRKRDRVERLTYTQLQARSPNTVQAVEKLIDDLNTESISKSTRK